MSLKISVASLKFTVHILNKGNGTPLQYSCLENPMDGGAWWAAVHGVARSRTRLSDFTFTFHLMHWRRKWQPLQGSCLENPRDEGAWWATDHGVARSRTRLSDFTFTFHLMHWRRKWQPLQCSCLENPRDGGAWWAAVSGVAQSRTRLKRLSSSSKQACKQPCSGSCVVGHVPYDRELIAFPSL